MEQCNKSVKTIFRLAIVTTITVSTWILQDITIGSNLGENISTMAQIIIKCYLQFPINKILTVFNLDLLNLIIQFLIILTYIAHYAAHNFTRKYLLTNKTLNL